MPPAVGDAIRRVTTRGPLVVFQDDGTPLRVKNYTCFFLYKFFLEGKDIEGLISELLSLGYNCVRVFGMSFYMDGGGSPEKEFIPSRYGAAYYDRIPEFAQHLASRGLRFEFTVFADARMIMPDRAEQRHHLERIVEKLRPEPNPFLEIENEWSVNQDTDLNDLKNQTWGDLLWASGDYAIERIDVKQPDGSFKKDPRPPMVVGRYVTYHGSRSDAWMNEAGKEGRYYYEGWDTINEDGNRSHGQRTGVPNWNDEPKGAFSTPTNHWGDERYTDWHEAEDAGAGFALSSAGGTFHSENGCMSRPLDATERECAAAMARALDWYPTDSASKPYEHDTTAGHIMKPIPSNQAGESVSRGLFAITSQIKSGFVPVCKDEFEVVRRSGWAGGMVEVKRR